MYSHRQKRLKYKYCNLVNDAYMYMYVHAVYKCMKLFNRSLSPSFNVKPFMDKNNNQDREDRKNLKEIESIKCGV